MSLADEVAEMAAGQRPLPAYDRTMGFRLVSWSPGGAVLEADADARFANPAGVLHGGLLMGLADSAMGLTVSGLVPAGQTCTNTDVHVRFLRACTGGRIRATARVVRRGSRVVVMECDVADAGGQLLAKASSTFLVIGEGTLAPR